MKTSPTAHATTGARIPRTSLSQGVARDVSHSLRGAETAIRRALEHTSKLKNRADIAALAGDLERLQKDLSEVKASAGWIARGKQ